MINIFFFKIIGYCYIRRSEETRELMNCTTFILNIKLYLDKSYKLKASFVQVLNDS